MFPASTAPTYLVLASPTSAPSFYHLLKHTWTMDSSNLYLSPAKQTAHWSLHALGTLPWEWSSVIHYREHGLEASYTQRIPSGQTSQVLTAPPTSLHCIGQTGNATPEAANAEIVVAGRGRRNMVRASVGAMIVYAGQDIERVVEDDPISCTKVPSKASIKASDRGAFQDSFCANLWRTASR
ncbi:hypothetical protein CPC08DRAFT_783210 [Agrocybe pediades]|nr:hypothetical protein CPC08DRAFT_783210 [Agrocybe pediades]